MTSAQSLIHGDLHTGSVFVREASGTPGAGAAAATGTSVRAFDSEFGFFGPTGFDLGILWANLVIAAARARALGEADRTQHILSLPAELWNAFEAESRALWPARRDPRVFGDEVLEALLTEFREDAAVYAGAEAIRRIVGFAKATDIETLEPGLREGAARAVLRAGRALIVERRGLTSVEALSSETAAIFDETINPAEL